MKVLILVCLGNLLQRANAFRSPNKSDLQKQANKINGDNIVGRGGVSSGNEESVRSFHNSIKDQVVSKHMAKESSKPAAKS